MPLYSTLLITNIIIRHMTDMVEESLKEAVHIILVGRVDEVIFTAPRRHLVASIELSV